MCCVSKKQLKTLSPRRILHSWDENWIQHRGNVLERKNHCFLYIYCQYRPWEEIKQPEIGKTDEGGRVSRARNEFSWLNWLIIDVEKGKKWDVKQIFRHGCEFHLFYTFSRRGKCFYKDARVDYNEPIQYFVYNILIIYNRKS